MRKATRYQPQIENLESITLLSGMFAGMHGPTASISTLAVPEPRRAAAFLGLNGWSRGTYQVIAGPPDMGATYKLSGGGFVDPLGKSHITGTVNQLGNVARGRARGQIVIAASRGDLTLTLIGPVRSGFSPLPERFSFKITSASGAYRHVRGHGTAILIVGQASPRADHHGFTLDLVP